MSQKDMMQRKCRLMKKMGVQKAEDYIHICNRIHGNKDYDASQILKKGHSLVFNKARKRKTERCGPYLRCACAWTVQLHTTPPLNSCELVCVCKRERERGLYVRSTIDECTYVCTLAHSIFFL